MRPLRGNLTLAEAAALTGVPKSRLSLYERGYGTPLDREVPRLEVLYGPPSGWWPAGVQKVLKRDIRHCLGCGEELPPQANTRRLYHDEKCRRHPILPAVKPRPVPPARPDPHAGVIEVGGKTILADAFGG